MKSDSAFSTSVHILTLLSHVDSNAWISSSFIAGSINMNAAMVRKVLILLNTHGLVISKEGKAGGVRIARNPDTITLNEVYLAVRDADEHIIQMYTNKPNAMCPIGCQIENKLDELYARIDSVVLAELGKTTIHDFHLKFLSS